MNNPNNCESVIVHESLKHSFLFIEIIEINRVDYSEFSNFNTIKNISRHAFLLI